MLSRLQFSDLKSRHWRGIGLVALVSVFACLAGIFTLPVLDRDEARFAQASAQMVQTGDLINIRFLDEARHKKPVGIYWMQAASAAITGAEDSRAIWAFRLPSVLGALLTAVFTALAGSRLFGRVAGFAGGALLGCSVLLATEGGIAKTDAMLAATCAAAFYGLVQLRLVEARHQRVWLLLWWGAVGLGTLLKGPVTPMVAGLSVLALFAIERDFKFVLKFADWPGPVLAGLIVLPWFIAIQFATGGAFFSEGLAQDLTPKLVSGHESHGAPPGVHLALLPILIFPGILFLPAGIAEAVRMVRQDRALPIILVVCFALPCWVVFELMPTKLPHYALPAYPALAALIGLGFAHWRTSPAWARWTGMAVFGAIAIIFAISFSTLTRMYGGISWMTLAMSALLIWCTVMAAFYALKARRGPTLVMAIAAGLSWHIGARGVVGPMASELHLSQRAAPVIGPLLGDQPRFSSYTEPSLVFLSGGAFQLTDPQTLSEGEIVSPALYVLDASRWLEDADLDARQARADFFDALLNEACHYDSVSGFNYSRGAPASLVIIQTGCPSAPETSSE